jgi:hypothetical protein
LACDRGLVMATRQSQMPNWGRPTTLPFSFRIHKYRITHAESYMVNSQKKKNHIWCKIDWVRRILMTQCPNRTEDFNRRGEWGQGPAAGLEGNGERWRWTADRRPWRRGEEDTDGDEERGKPSSAGGIMASSSPPPRLLRSFAVSTGFFF